MSPLWPELLRITLCPDRVVLERGKLIISLKGVEPRYFEAEVIPVDPRHEPALWAVPLAMLGIALDGLPERPRDAAVILSNHFVHYPLVQSDMPATQELPTAIIEPELETALRDLLQQRNCRLTTLQPRIVALGTSQLDELQGEPGWLVVVEEGLACLGLIQDWEFTRLRSLYMLPASSVELLALLDREASIAGLRQPPRNLLLWKRDESDEVALPINSGWQIIRLGERSPMPTPGRRTASSHFPLLGARA